MRASSQAEQCTTEVQHSDSNERACGDAPSGYSAGVHLREHGPSGGERLSFHPPWLRASSTGRLRGNSRGLGFSTGSSSLIRCGLHPPTPAQTGSGSNTSCCTRCHGGGSQWHHPCAGGASNRVVGGDTAAPFAFLNRIVEIIRFKSAIKLVLLNKPNLYLSSWPKFRRAHHPADIPAMCHPSWRHQMGKEHGVPLERAFMASKEIHTSQQTIIIKKEKF